MFIEPSPISRKNSEQKGQIEVICGSMFSGKTEELIRRLTRARLAKQQVEIFKPSVDTRYHDTHVVSHNETSIRSTPVSFAGDILLLSGTCDVVGIDEAQFFDEEIVRVVQLLANQGKRVILAGLDMDFEGMPSACNVGIWPLSPTDFLQLPKK
jgi:thymidine kinase